MEKKEFNLTMKQSTYLVSLIFLGFVFKVFVPSDVIINKGVIDHIDGLEFEEGKIIMKKNIYDIHLNVAPEIILGKKLMSDEWDKFIVTLQKV